MDLYPAEKVRNVALIGHTGTGKTTLAEALLYRAGLVARVGTVEEGTTVTDYQPEEKARSISTSIALAPIEWNGYKINIIDTPGMADFEGEVAAALSAVDLAVFVVSASDGVEPNTEHYWRLAAELGVPRMIFINKLDRENASFDEILAELRSTLGTGVAPIELPIGAGAGFHGVADLFRDTAYIYDSGHAEVVPIPEEMAQREHAVHDNLVEGIVVADDELLEAFGREYPVGGSSRRDDEERCNSSRGISSRLWVRHSAYWRGPSGRLHLRGRPFARRPTRHGERRAEFDGDSVRP